MAMDVWGLKRVLFRSVDRYRTLSTTTFYPLPDTCLVFGIVLLFIIVFSPFISWPCCAAFRDNKFCAPSNVQQKHAKGAALELLVRGADPRLRNQAGETALQAAIANGRTDCAELVRDFLRRPTFEPDEGTPPPPSSLPPSPATALPSRPSSQPAAARIGLGIVTKGEGDEIGVRAAVGGVAAVAPEVSRANTVFCLGRRRRRLGASVRPGRGLGVGVGTAAAEVSLGARRRARLHSANPCVGTSMEAFVLWSIASGQDPFHGEGGVEDSDSDKEGGNKANEVWLDYYVRVYNAR